jgi:integrase
MATLQVQLRKLSTGERFPVLKYRDTGQPLFLPTVFTVSALRSVGRSVKTIEGYLRAISLLYRWCIGRNEELERRFARGDYLSRSEIEDLASALSCSERVTDRDQAVCVAASRVNLAGRPQLERVVRVEASDATRAVRMARVRYYLDWLSVWSFSSALSISAQRAEDIEVARQRMLDGLRVRAPSQRRGLRQPKKGLDKTQQELIRRCFLPTSPNNPWRLNHVRSRNQLIYLCLFETGMRSGELLGLKLDDIDLRTQKIRIHRRADDLDDPRVDQPNAKTRPRELPISDCLADLFLAYISNDRRSLAGAKKHPFVFVTHKSGGALGQPLSIEGFKKVFKTVAMKSGVAGFSAHVLRHTWNDRFSELTDATATISEAREQQIRSYLQGWSPTSGTASTYTRRHTEAAAHRAIASLHSLIDASD